MPDRYVPTRNSNAMKNLASYQMYSNFYKGGRFVKNPSPNTLDPDRDDGSSLPNQSYLHPFQFESEEAFAARKRRAPYRNYSKDVVRVNVATIFEQGNSIDRREVEEDLGSDIFLNIDGAGSSIPTFIRRIARETFIYGWVGVFTDFGIDTPFSKIILPLDLYDWVYNPILNRWEYLLFSEGYTDDGSQKFRIVDPFRWHVLNDKGEILAQGDHDYEGDLPFDLFICDEPSTDDDDEPFGYGAISDIADLQRENFDLSSELEDLVRKVNFPMLHVQGPPPSGTGKGAGARGPLPIGPDYALFTEKNVAWISPDILAIDKTRALLDANEKEIREIAGIATRSEESTEAHSGAALRWEYSTKLSLIKLRAENIRDGETRLYRRYEKILDRPIRWNSIKYPSDYATSPVPEELNNLKMLKDMTAPKPILQAQLKSIVMKTFYHRSDLDELLESCDEWLEEEEQTPIQEEAEIEQEEEEEEENVNTEE